MASNFTLIQQEDRARAGVWSLPHGDVPTPAFMPVGTRGAVKTLAPWEVAPLSNNIILANTYHLIIRPGVEHLKKAGGLHQWMNWSGNILTDSGGYQVMSLASLRKIDDAGVSFRSHLDGKMIRLTPESVVNAQATFGSDVMMVLDECTPFPATREQAAASMKLSMKWARQARVHWEKTRVNSSQQLFGIVQGGMEEDLRRESVAELIDMDFDGYSIGGLSVGEPKEQMRAMTSVSAGALPAQKIRYLMGVGKPEDLVESVALGVDVFDCVLATRNARNGGFFWTGRPGHGNIRNARYRELHEPLDTACGCRGCHHFSASFIYEQFKAGEILALRMLTEHNLWVLKDLMAKVRSAIIEERFFDFLRAFRKDEETLAPRLADGAF